MSARRSVGSRRSQRSTSISRASSSRASTRPSSRSSIRPSSRTSTSPSSRQSTVQIEESKPPEAAPIEEEKEDLRLVPHSPGRWTKKEIHFENFDPASKTITFRAGLFGAFALIVPRYQQFPFKSWQMRPGADGAQTVMLSLDVKHTKLDFEVSPQGIKCGIYLKTKSFLVELIPIVKEYATLEEVQTVSCHYSKRAFKTPSKLR